MRAALGSYLGAFVKNTYIIQFLLVSLFTWHSADLPSTEPAIAVIFRHNWLIAGQCSNVRPALKVAS